ncbi:unnamed protein product [Vitrella brassicaformis CCMP3155]|uniref:F-box domain-containing protein n=2 Tax=Vitrella brassicaformis TaxID=1169539 RepID=A0A0G4EHE3_VITBC|nr:unnamed protein product [Vitrella brassicaformis CCMP3155]|mmetsp:Transcript_13976/g.40233  ORF Transcript_13976/g.40233 Transcript_13976/m.40233 type:complete len:564 (+) Transcript_13976:102-1793(+)|eukprot:CEL95204.1 unnamed protein product [Vitrella brassicaformis CCMP3155]
MLLAFIALLPSVFPLTTAHGAHSSAEAMLQAPLSSAEKLLRLAGLCERDASSSMPTDEWLLTKCHQLDGLLADIDGPHARGGESLVTYRLTAPAGFFPPPAHIASSPWMSCAILLLLLCWAVERVAAVRSHLDPAAAWRCACQKANAVHGACKSAHNKVLSSKLVARLFPPPSPSLPLHHCDAKLLTTIPMQGFSVPLEVYGNILSFLETPRVITYGDVSRDALAASRSPSAHSHLALGEPLMRRMPSRQRDRWLKVLSGEGERTAAVTRLPMYCTSTFEHSLVWHHAAMRQFKRVVVDEWSSRTQMNTNVSYTASGVVEEQKQGDGWGHTSTSRGGATVTTTPGPSHSPAADHGYATLPAYLRAQPESDPFMPQLIQTQYHFPPTLPNREASRPLHIHFKSIVISLDMARCLLYVLERPYLHITVERVTLDVLSPDASHDNDMIRHIVKKVTLFAAFHAREVTVACTTSNSEDQWRWWGGRQPTMRPLVFRQCRVLRLSGAEDACLPFPLKQARFPRLERVCCVRGSDELGNDETDNATADVFTVFDLLRKLGRGRGTLVRE